MLYPEHFDVIVVGGGHAGTEAALAAARMGAKTLLLSHNIETLGQMSCNPSIGGIGKGHLVKEVDAMGGAMALATDEAGIQFRILNSSKGPAVRATRAQADRILYKAAIRRMLENQPNLQLFQQAVDDLIIEGDRVVGAVTQVGIQFRAKTVVLTAGTFLDGKIHVGLNNYAAGRAGDPPAVSLSARLKELKLPQGRLKTGTPPRIDGRTIDFSKCLEQPGDGTPGGMSPVMPVFSFMGRVAMHPRQVPCWITHTNERTHDIIRSGFDRSPKIHWVELGRAGDQHHVDAVDDSLITIEPDEAMLVVDDNLLGLGVCQQLTFVLYTVGKQISHRVLRSCRRRLRRGQATASAARSRLPLAPK